jgi:hypothetical protein
MRVSVCVHRPLCFGGCSFAQPSTSSGTPLAEFNYLFRYRYTFSVAVARSHPFSPEKGLPGLRWLVETATPPPVHKKSFLTIAIHNAFFVLLGCLL